MRRPDRVRPDDDGRVIADMELLDAQSIPAEKGGAERPQISPLTRAETRGLMVSATLAGLTVAGVLSLAVVGLVLFCQFVWFR